MRGRPRGQTPSTSTPPHPVPLPEGEGVELTMPSLTLAEIATLLHAPAPAAHANRTVTGMATLAEAGPNDLSFLGSDGYLTQFATTKAAAVIVQKRVKLPRDAAPATPVFVVDDADLSVAKILEHFAPSVPRPPV